MDMTPIRTLVLVSWDGRSKPFALVNRDADPRFDLALFDYSGGTQEPEADLRVTAVLRQKTECKGQIFAAFHAYLVASDRSYDYVALIDDDIEVDISALNLAIHMAVDAGLDLFGLSLTTDSFCDHRRFLQRPTGGIRTMPWIEVMMPFYRQSLFLAAGNFYRSTISSYGLDQFAMPLVCKVTGLSNIATIDARAARHTRAVSSGGKVYANGLTAHQERWAMRRRCLTTIRRDYPSLLATRWYYATYAPINGPIRFWVLYLLAPWDLALRLVSARRPRQSGRGSAIGRL